MIIADFTKPELDYFRENCNFVNDEIDVFELRSKGHTMEETAELLNISIDKAYKISRKVKKKNTESYLIFVEFLLKKGRQ